MSYEYERVLQPSSGLRLHLNENTAGCSPRVLAALHGITREQAACYPDYEQVTHACAERFGVTADQIVLKNGDRLTGTIVKSDGKTIVLKSDMVGEVSIALDNVETVTADKPLYVTLNDGRTVSGLVTAKNSQFEIKSNSGTVAVERSAVAVVRSEAEQRAYESTLNPGLLEQWNGGADVGFTATSAEVTR